MANAYLENFIPKTQLPIYFHYDSVRNGTLPISPHYHDKLELLYITHGLTKVQINDIEVTAKRGDFIAIPSNAIHSCISIDGLSKYHTLIIESNYCEILGFNTARVNFETPINDAKINDIMEDIVYEYYSENEYSHAKVMERIIHLLLHLFTNHKKENEEIVSRINFDQITQAIAYINENYSTDLTIKKIAHYVGMSVSHFGHVFKKVTRMSPMYCINLIRCQKAAALISQGKHSISQIAYMCGFKDASYFTKTFKKYTKILPSQY